MSLYNELNRLIQCKQNGDLKRLGVPFSTPLNHYFYDSGTGKVIQLDDSSSSIIKALYDENIQMSDVSDLRRIEGMNEMELVDFDQLIDSEHLFRLVKPTRLYTSDHYENLENKVNHGVEQVILELTGKCNLRCGYCIYNEEFAYNRSFNNEDMTEETAKACVDYIAQRGADKVAVTFYGGEPLVKFDLLKSTVEYARERITDKVLSFSLTTNLTLINEEIASYLASVPNMSIVASIDGPEIIHNSYRKYSNGRGTFTEALRGLKLLSEAIEKYKKAVLSINTVYAPPFSNKKIEEINKFFSSLEFLPANCSVQITYPSDGSIDHLSEETLFDSENSLLNFMRTVIRESSQQDGQGYNRYTTSILSPLVRIHNRFLMNDPVDSYPFNACCVPGARRLYIDTKGDFYVCEKIGNSPSIGNIRTGIDIDELKRNYIEEFSDKSIGACSKCWAIRICPRCYTGRFDENGKHLELNEHSCENQRRGVVEDIILYHTILESEPKQLEIVEQIVMS